MKSYEFILEDEMLNEGALQKIASVALGIALGFSATIAKADQLFVYQHPETQKLKIAKSKERIPQDALMSFVVDTDSKTVKIIKGNQETPVQTEPAVVQKAEQTVAQKALAPTVEPKATEPVKEPVAKSEPKADAPVVTPVAEPPKAKELPPKNIKSELSKFSIKGLRFGMSKEEVKNITKTSSTYSWEVFGNFSIGGKTGWQGIFGDEYGSGDEKLGLGQLYTSIKPDDFQDWAEKLTSKYGKPSWSNTSTVSNKMGYSDLNAEMRWKVNDVVIFLKRYDGKFTEGSITFQWNKWADDMDRRDSEKKKKNKKDF